MITKHFEQRVKDRKGLSKKASKEIFETALKEGLSYEDCACRPSLIKYLDSIKKSDTRDFLISERYIIITINNHKTAITILDLPKEFYSTVKSIYKNKRKEVENNDITAGIIS